MVQGSHTPGHTHSPTTTTPTTLFFGSPYSTCMPLKYQNKQQRREARLKSKRKCYERHKLDEQLKSRTRWRKHVGATVATQHLLAQLDLIWLNLGYQPGSQYSVLSAQGLMLVHEADDEGWQVVRPHYEHVVVEAQDLLSEARNLLASALHAEGACTDHLISRSATAVDAVELHCDVWDEALSLMDDDADMYFEAFTSDQLVWQKALKPR
ncbi:hypothetical protein EDB19DRAFT_1911551 [Suillus lakei]|nr:hypothetical protein EDB19DRAFT_1911551 [Suillus lakei]